MHVMHLDHDSAIQKVRVAEDAWNTRDPRIFRQWAHKKAGIPDSGLFDHEMVAGVRFELTTFGYAI